MGAEALLSGQTDLLENLLDFLRHFGRDATRCSRWGADRAQ